MTDLRLSQTTAAGALTGSELAYVVQSGNSRRTTVGAIAALAPPTNLSYDEATRLLSSSNGTDVTLPLVSPTVAGLLSEAGWLKLDSIVVDRATLTVAPVRNNSGATIAKGTPVIVTGSSGTTKTIAPADASTEATAANTLGLTLDAIANNADGLVVTEGPLSGVNTAGLTEGQLFYLSETTGGVTSTRPTQPAHGVVLGWCVKTGAGTSGILYVKVDNGVELDELHDVLITSPTAGQVLRRAADGLWKNAVLAASDINGISGTNTGDVTLAASVADVLSLVDQELQADDPGGDRLLFWDDSEGKLRHLELGSNLSITGTTLNAAGGGGGISDGDKGDITVSSSGSTWTIDAGAVSYAKIQDVSATDRILGRSSAGAGDVEEITCTAAARALLDDVDAAAQRATLGAEDAGAAAAAVSAHVAAADPHPVYALESNLGTAAGAASSDFVSATTTRAANLVLAGPTSGAAAAPTFRALVTADLPAVTYSQHSTITTSGSPSTYTLDAAAYNEFTASAAVAGNITITCSNLTSVPTGQVWRAVFRFAYTSGAITLGAPAGVTAKVDVPTLSSGKSYDVIARYLGGGTTIGYQFSRGEPT